VACSTPYTLNANWWYHFEQLGIDVKWDGDDDARVDLTDRSGDLHLNLNLLVDPKDRGFLSRSEAERRQPGAQSRPGSHSALSHPRLVVIDEA
jgi:hypothetical protein